MHKVNKMQNDQLILRHTTTDHASLLLFLLRKRNMHYHHHIRVVCSYTCRPQESVNAVCRIRGGNKDGLKQMLLSWSPETSTHSWASCNIWTVLFMCHVDLVAEMLLCLLQSHTL